MSRGEHDAACTCDPEAYDCGPEGQRRYFPDRYCPIHGEAGEARGRSEIPVTPVGHPSPGNAASEPRTLPCPKCGWRFGHKPTCPAPDAACASRPRLLDLFCGAGGAAMGIDWMTGAELVEAIPPDYTEAIGRKFLIWKGARERVAA